MTIRQTLSPVLRLLFWFWCAGALTPLLPVRAADSPPRITVRASDSSATLTAVTDGITAGEPLRLLLTLSPLPGWHTYWQNPGDAGAPLDLSWALPEGFRPDPVRWPLPERIDTPPLVSFGYSGPVTFPLTVATPPALSGSGAASGTRITLTARYLVCADTCIPQSVTLTLPLPSVTSPQALAAARWSAAEATLPQETPPLAPTRLNRTGNLLQLTFARAILPPGDWQEAFFFPTPTGALVNSAAQNPSLTPDALTLTLTPQDDAPGDLPGLLRLTAADGRTAGVPVRISLPAAPPEPAPDPSAAPVAHPAALAPLTALALAFLGGLILNIMPCVFPVLSLKVLALSRHSAREHRETLRESLAYAAGVIGSFIALAALLIALRSAAAEIGWGFQLQEPWFVGALALLLFAVGLNLSGLYEIPQLWRGSQPHRHGLLQSALTGVLAVLLATPCTAPFMAPAIGFGLAQPPVITLAVFAALGFGFALPFVLAGLFPRALRRLPRPGPWMLTFRRVLAFPMYASAVWLAWVLAQQSTPNGVGLLLTAALVLASALTCGRQLARRPKILVALLAGTTVAALLRMVPSAPAEPLHITAETFSTERLTRLRQSGHPVFVNVTAAWCITCKMNERLVLSRPEIKAFFKAHDITVLTADWTRADPAITAYLQSFGRAGVPLYVYYPPHAQGIVLPQILEVTDITILTNNH